MRNEIVAIIKQSYSEIAPDRIIPEESHSLLPGEDLESREFVSLILSVEQKLEAKYQKPFVLLDEAAFSRGSSPFRSVSAFAEFIIAQIDQADA